MNQTASLPKPAVKPEPCIVCGEPARQPGARHCDHCYDRYLDAVAAFREKHGFGR
jgi:hypothetical protein